MNEYQKRVEEKPKINWEKIKKRVDSLKEVLNLQTILSPEEKHIILKARAKVLADENEETSCTKKYIDIIEFGLASEKYGIENMYVREVYPLKDFTTLPGLPSFVLGIINVRGQIVSVIDLKKFFNLPWKGIGELNKVIILRNQQMEFGILCDTVYDARSISLDLIQKSPVCANGISADYLKGITEDFTIILDVKKILKDKKIIIHQEVD
ncbi:MAG: chemotaxis protein CheW [bacterium]